MALFFCLEFRDTLAGMIDREQLRAELIGLFDSHGHFKSRVANERSLARRGLWEPLVTYSSPDARSPMDRITEVLLRLDPRCPVCGDRCNRLTGGAVFGFSTCCSSRCRGFAARGISIVHDGEFHTKPLDTASPPAAIHDPTLRDERNAFVAECQNTYRTECREKAVTRSREYHDTHKDEMRAYFKQWRDANPTYSQDYKNSHREEVRARKYSYYHNHDGSERRRKYWRTHKAKCKAINDKYRLSHPGQHNAAGARRRAIKLNATPPWLTRRMKLEIQRVYVAASEMYKRDGVRYQVDHIIPLQGDTVCGLHVPWNLQILTINENASKGNKLLSESEVQACATRMKAIMERHGR